MGLFIYFLVFSNESIRVGFDITSNGVPLLLRGRTQPMPFPLGYLKQLGLSSMAAAVATMFISSASFEGAITTIFGKHAMKVVSNAPQ